MKTISAIANWILGKVGLRLVRATKQSHDNASLFPGESAPAKEGRYSLVLIGAHSGEKTEALVSNALLRGKVCLIEPVPWLFEELIRRHNGKNGLRLINKCVTVEEMDSVSFYVPRRDANSLYAWADQLGSRSKLHALQHDHRLGAFFQEEQVSAVSIRRLLDEIECAEIELLLTDIEGYDVELLGAFPFDRVRPARIVFEHKHADGIDQIGKRFAHLITKLEEMNYVVRVLDKENCLAEDSVRPVPSSAA